mmetsp:Transcript_33621/g.73487  ORF Transcript_33621/g.73487 Transcript_33621/m.73487 type:complete len:216 (-) Transcript_33621:106-753(-)|eukprot:CAMPEP_0204256252 /NCGR_PEP_ID=MMETSP0468-20130131/3664_1 /ASSEMBLY_ACC=CAM_ASM_000383 /TAXON_ID=2969 /ORGANISM="Oxyrrhis marina" /LENGTH=215 /DNA_ID=CAMNT_0051230189 /DNA_START=50 /DNA_END=697 /DNA_ORIENTATION=+
MRLTLCVAGAAGFGQSCSQGPVGSCYVMGCHAARGPTTCDAGQCYCEHGYCAAGSLPVRCRARVGSCEYLPCTGHGGVVSGSVCVEGVCLCRSFFHAGGPDKRQCVKGWWPSTSLVARVANATYGDENVEALAADSVEHKEDVELPDLSEEELDTSSEVEVPWWSFAAAATEDGIRSFGAPLAALGFVAVALRRRLRSAGDHGASYEAMADPISA